ncbi:MAG: spermidine/putrescine ABC transporter substrate-binding protein [Chthoniobacterales bacterium]|jgi:spermidine/putrescine transport system substrate-binding protein
MKKTTAILTSAVCAAAILLAGCGKKDDTLNLFCWTEYVPQAVIDKFTEETGIKVAMETYSSNEEMLAKLLAGGGDYDLIQPSEYTVEAMIKEGLLQPLDHEKIPNLKNLAPEFRKMPFDPGNKYSVAWLSGFVGIVYNAETVTTPVVGYNDVFTPQHAGRIVTLDDPREITSWALANSGIPVNDVTDENLAKVTPMLKDWMSKIKVYDSDSPKTSLSNGDVDIGVIWSGEGAILFKENPKFQWVLPAEGFHMFIDSLAVPKTAHNKDLAEQFINFILRPDIGKMILADFPYYSPNAEARKLLSPEELNNPASYPPGLDITKAQLFKDIGAQGSKVDELITSLKVQQ